MLEGIETKEAPKPEMPSPEQREEFAQKAHEQAVEVGAERPAMETKEGGRGASFSTPDWMEDED